MAHSKSEADVAAGVVVVCRSCGTNFNVNGSVAERRASKNIPVTEFHQAQTDVMRIPAKVAARALEAQQEAEEPEPARPSGAAAAIRQELRAIRDDVPALPEPVRQDPHTVPTAQLGAGAPQPPPEEIPANATSISSVGQIREMLDRMKVDANAAAVEEPVAAPMVAPAEAAYVPAETPKAPRPSRLLHEPVAAATGLSFSDEPPVTRKSATQEATVAARSVADAAQAWASFPTAALRAWLIDRWRWLALKPMAVRVGVAAGVLVVAVALIVGLVLGLSDKPARRYIDDARPLMAGPGAEDLYPKVTELLRGEEVIWFEGVGFGEWEMVRDTSGRVGYVVRDVLSEHRPMSRAGVAFVGCHQTPIEVEAAGCLERAHLQFDSCRGLCDEDPNPTPCGEQCQRQLDTCVSGCEGHQAVAPVPQPEPAGELQEAPPADIADDKTAKQAKPVKKPKKPKRR